MSHLHIGDLTDRITLDLAKPMIAKLARERVARNRLSPNEEQLLIGLVKLKKATATELAKEIKKSPPYVSKVMTYLASMKLVESRNPLCQYE